MKRRSLAQPRKAQMTNFLSRWKSSRHHVHHDPLSLIPPIRLGGVRAEGCAQKNRVHSVLGIFLNARQPTS